MKEKIFDFLKGIIIGIGNILPGFSGGVMAVAFNVYDKIIFALSNFLKQPLKVIKDVWALALGIGFGILIAIIGISLLLEFYPIPTVFFFTGLIVGSIPTIYEKIKAKSYSWQQFLAFILGFLLITGFLILSIFYEESSSIVVVSTINLKLVIILFVLGIISASTMIIPGVSGSLVLLVLGYYYYIVNLIKDFLKAILALDFQTIFMNIVLVLALGLGLVVGLIILSKPIEKLIAKYPKTFYAAVLGLLLASPFAIIYQMYIEYQAVIEDALIINWILGILFLVVGVIASNYITKAENKKLEKI